MITALAFSNFRCFQDFSLTGLKRITLVSGQNNSGKTALLEGIYLMLGGLKANVLLDLDFIRGIEFGIAQQDQARARMNIEPLKLWQTLFYNMDAVRPLEVGLVMDGQTDCALRLVQKARSSIDINIENYLPVSSMPASAVSLHFSCHVNDKEIASGNFEINGSALAHNSQVKRSAPLFPQCFYLGPGRLINQQTVAEWIGQIDLANSRGRLVTSLARLMPQITDIFVVTQQGGTDIFCRLENGKALPIRAMGDGINKLLVYLAAMTGNRGAIFLLDEIENGFHYSFLETLWELLFAAARDNDCQIIATTHSRECIGAAIQAESSCHMRELAYFRIDSPDGMPMPTGYGSEALAYAIGHEMEVR